MDAAGCVKEEVGKRVRSLRLKTGLSLEEFGSRMTPPLGKAGLQQIEVGQNALLVTRLVDICDIAGCAPEDLVRGLGRKSKARKVKAEAASTEPELAELPAEATAELPEAN